MDAGARDLAREGRGEECDLREADTGEWELNEGGGALAGQEEASAGRGCSGAHRIGVWPGRPGSGERIAAAR